MRATHGTRTPQRQARGPLVSGIVITLAAFASVLPTTGIFADTTPSLIISEVHPSGSSNGTYGAETGSPGARFVSSPASVVDLSTYVRVGRFDLPEPTRTTPPANSLLAQEVSGVAYNWDTDTLFVVGDGGTSVVQVTKTGQLIDSMTLAPGSSPQGTAFYDPEGITYVGDGKFVLVEERDRQAVLFTYVAGGTLTRADTRTVTLGTFVDNIGIEGISYDPLTVGFIAVKETQPQGVFQTGIDFEAGTATNGSPTTANSTNLFDPALAGLLDFADVFALSNLPTAVSGSDAGHLLILSQESGKIIHVDRSGHVFNSLTIRTDPGNPLSVPEQQHEGLTMDRDGNLYVVSENGGGDFNHPQLWVYATSLVPNQAPSGVVLSHEVQTIAENSNTAGAVKVADVGIIDDELGTNALTVTGPDADAFQVDATGLYLKAGTVLDFENKTSYTVTVAVDDPTVGGTPDASAIYTLSVTDVPDENPSSSTLVITEVAPWSSGNSPVGADWFEVTNIGGSAVSLGGWRMDDSSESFDTGVPLSGIASIAPGESVIFIETNNLASAKAAFLATWFGANPPAGLQIGSYSGSGVGLSTGGDAVALFNSNRVLQAKVSFGASPGGPSFPTFDNTAGLPIATVTQLSAVGVHGAFAAANDVNEVGSPGAGGKLAITEVAPWSSGNSPVGADWFEVTNIGSAPVTLAGWRMDDSSESFEAAVPLSGIASIAPGESVIFLETNNLASVKAAFLATWFGATPPAGLQIGSYSGSGVGLSTGGDAVVLYNSDRVLQAKVSFGVSPGGPSFPTFDNAAGLNSGAISLLSVVGTHGALAAASDATEIGSPGTTTSTPTVIRGGFGYNRATGRFLQPVTLRNDSTGAMTGPIYLALDTLTNGSLANATGITTNRAPLGSPYLTVLPAAGTLPVGGSVSVTLQFINPSMAPIGYTARPLVLTGTGTP